MRPGGLHSPLHNHPCGIAELSAHSRVDKARLGAVGKIDEQGARTASRDQSSDSSQTLTKSGIIKFSSTIQSIHLRIVARWSSITTYRFASGPFLHSPAGPQQYHEYKVDQIRRNVLTLNKQKTVCFDLCLVITLITLLSYPQSAASAGRHVTACDRQVSPFCPSPRPFSSGAAAASCLCCRATPQPQRQARAARQL